MHQSTFMQPNRRASVRHSHIHPESWQRSLSGIARSVVHSTMPAPVSAETAIALPCERARSGNPFSCVEEVVRDAVMSAMGARSSASMDKVFQHVQFRAEMYRNGESPFRTFLVEARRLRSASSEPILSLNDASAMSNVARQGVMFLMKVYPGLKTRAAFELSCSVGNIALTLEMIRWMLHSLDRVSSCLVVFVLHLPLPVTRTFLIENHSTRCTCPNRASCHVLPGQRRRRLAPHRTQNTVYFSRAGDQTCFGRTSCTDCL
jgi:hypothetical protein